jgi:hypothetical protein
VHGVELQRLLCGGRRRLSLVVRGRAVIVFEPSEVSDLGAEPDVVVFLALVVLLVALYAGALSLGRSGEG